MRLPMGTRSILYGAHCFFLHPFFVALAWRRLYGMPWDPRLWVAFIVHDLGYIGKPNMDGSEGEAHPELGARIMSALFGKAWGNFCLYHSRVYAKRAGVQPSRLCIADKLAFCVTPRWLYLPMVKWTGEVQEYVTLSQYWGLDASAIESWYVATYTYLLAWVAAHKDGQTDTWTPDPVEKDRLL